MLNLKPGIPPRKRGEDNQRILLQFIEEGLSSAKVECDEKRTPQSLRTCLTYTAKRLGLPIRVSVIDGNVYLLRKEEGDAHR